MRYILKFFSNYHGRTLVKPTSQIKSGLFECFKHVIMLGLISIVAFNQVKAQFPDEFQKVELLTGLSNAVKFRFAPDGRVFILDRYGEIIIYKPSLQTSVSGGILPVFHELEDGLIGIAFDPDFATNNHLYLHYSPQSSSVNRVSRFTMNGDMLDQSSEIVIIEWNVQRATCCHSGGDMAFDSNGNLYIAVGDNTNHTLYATLDEIDINFSSEKSSSNTNDLRGKILRITPQPDGSYTIPSGNLFSGGVGGLPEIYVMGARNPYSIFVDKEQTDWLFWGEVGPDANVAGPEGPEGKDEINLTKSAGNFGWPYFSGNNEPYLNQYTDPPFYYNPAQPMNLSKWNTGSINLPPAQPAWLDFFHKSYLTGPRYYYDPAPTDPQRLPLEFDGILFYFDFNTSGIWVVEMDQNGNVIQNVPFAPSVFPVSNTGFIDMKIGPDGHLYILEYGAGCCPSVSGAGKLVRVDYTGNSTNAPPVVKLSANPTFGPIPLTVNFSSAGTFDPNGDPLNYQWDFQSDGVFDSSQKNPMFTYTVAGTYLVTLKVTDNSGASGTETITIFAGNAPADISITSPKNGGLFDWFDDIDFDLEATDPEDGSTTNGGIDCQDLTLFSNMVHSDHSHPQGSLSGCEGSITLSASNRMAINTGGGAYSSEGASFETDQYATGGELFSNEVAIAETVDDVLYQTERYGNLVYQIPLQDPGDYTVKLHFAEIYHGVEIPGGKGDRIFDVSLEGTSVLTDFDILDEVAPATALIKEFPKVAINDGLLNIGFSGTTGNPKVSAIELFNSEQFDIYGRQKLSYTLQATYTDQGGLESVTTIELYPKRHEAEFFDDQSGTTIIANSDPWGGGNASIRVADNSYIKFSGRNLANITAVRYRTASAAKGGNIELRIDGPSGSLLSSTEVSVTGSWSSWQDTYADISDPGGIHDLYFVFKNEPGDESIFDLNYIEFGGAGISVDNSPPDVLQITTSTNQQVEVEFSEKVSKESAENTVNYLINQGIFVNGAMLAPDDRTVILEVSELQSNIDYLLSLSGVKNIAGLEVEQSDYPIQRINGEPDPKVPKLRVYPNPTINQVTLDLELNIPEVVSITIYDAAGREFYSSMEQLNAGRNLRSLDLQNMAEGLYYLKVNSRGTNLPGYKLIVRN